MEDIKIGVQILRLLKQIGDIIKNFVAHEYEDYDITGTQGVLMGILSFCGQMKISELSKRMGLSNSTVSGIIDRLERQGLVERKRSEEDRRVVYVDITPVVKEAFEERFNEIERKLNIALGKASDQDLSKIVEGLEILKKILESQDYNNAK